MYLFVFLLFFAIPFISPNYGKPVIRLLALYFYNISRLPVARASNLFLRLMIVPLSSSPIWCLGLMHIPRVIAARVTGVVNPFLSLCLHPALCHG